MSELTVRQAARVIVVNPAAQVFMIHVRDIYDPTRTWWETPGGGAELGEDPRRTAVRELAEETGIECEPMELTGPLASHRASITLSDGVHIQDEVFYGLLCSDDEDLDNALRTDLEKKAILETAWLDLDAVVVGPEGTSAVGVMRPVAVGELARLVVAGLVPDMPLRLRNGRL
ncbi:NUDIX domain-containing protein [Brevibacterium sp. 50QC2O2]|jgi:8-oxo-dGTP pyrophosphatase MutT (NUDIX family)|uniref:NUDIX hydrolase n=1 Tax=Brevibacterium TaxID=1696 RepID=UPI00211C1F15|nr:MULTISPECIES: NUDIX domain-containing protein [unclassified Brevibacterium]MCQ9366916.1 NUDIX domain-containing protein [Brevibacterium sp. 91QC2O2]MCQ9384066.1 NUDIX domain-containing protein [Brevibacterium sp. 68QC2CO]MCQ9389080.1 NUDIX domain-containing protein [Brevibacterium sp. 50QC2O2]